MKGLVQDVKVLVEAVLVVPTKAVRVLLATRSWLVQACTLIKKKRKIFLIYKEMQVGLGAKSYMRKGFLIYEEMRKYLAIYEEAVSHI
jgi:hypothetical protein